MVTIDLLVASSFKVNAAVTSVALAFNAKPGTVGKAAVPAKSPANLILPFVFASASAIVAVAICASTYVLTAFWVGYKISLVPNVVTIDLLVASSFKVNAAVTSVVLAFNAKPGTVGKAAVPAKSPANLILPFVFASASAMVAVAT